MNLKNLFDAIAKLQTTHPNIMESDLKFKFMDEDGVNIDLNLTSLRVEGGWVPPERGNLELMDINWTHKLIFELVTR